MSSLAYFLERTEQAADAITQLEFKKPAIFTNAFTKNPPITQLLKDANANEAKLYKITRSDDPSDQAQLKPERVDGKSYFVDAAAEDNDGRRTAVVVPQIAKEDAPASDIASSPTRRSASSSKVLGDNIGDIDQWYATIAANINRMPSMGSKQLREEVETLKQEHVALSREVNHIEGVLDKQRRQLHSFNIDWSSSSDDRDDDEVDVDELIRKEEAEIEELERELSER